MWQQTLITLRPRSRGFHLVTDDVLAALPGLANCRVGLLHLLLQHTSASLTLNENADPSVRRDFERFFNRLKHFRAVANRFEKDAANYLALVKLASARLWMRFMSR